LSDSGGFAKQQAAGFCRLPNVSAVPAFNGGGKCWSPMAPPEAGKTRSKLKIEN